MASSILANVETGPVLLTLAGAIMLMTGGLSLIAFVTRARHDLIDQRVSLVQPRATFTKAEAKAVKSEADPFRRSEGGGSEASQREIARIVSKLGVPINRVSTYFVASRLVAAAIAGVLVLLWARNIAAFAAYPLVPIIAMAIIAIIIWFLPMIFIAHAVRRRAKVVKTGLPDALEMLVVCVEAGLSFEDGLDRVVNELRRSQPALADELGLTLADLRILPSQEQALTNLANRVDIPSVRTIVTTLTQTLRYGTPLAQALRVVAAEMRNDSIIELEERANRLPALMTLPVMLFLMPTIFLIVGGPAALKLIDSFQHFHLGPA